jgi:hypothetical protein
MRDALESGQPVISRQFTRLLGRNQRNARKGIGENVEGF